MHPTDKAIEKLLMAVVVVSIRDAARRNSRTGESARRFLFDEGWRWLQYLGYHITQAQMCAWIDQGCPQKRAQLSKRGQP